MTEKSFKAAFKYQLMRLPGIAGIFLAFYAAMSIMTIISSMTEGKNIETVKLLDGAGAAFAFIAGGSLVLDNCNTCTASGVSRLTMTVSTAAFSMVLGAVLSPIVMVLTYTSSVIFGTDEKWLMTYLYGEGYSSRFEILIFCIFAFTAASAAGAASGALFLRFKPVMAFWVYSFISVSIVIMALLPAVTYEFRGMRRVLMGFLGLFGIYGEIGDFHGNVWVGMAGLLILTALLSAAMWALMRRAEVRPLITANNN